jgi:hypothetical protein
MDATTKKKKDAPTTKAGDAARPEAKRLPIKTIRVEDVSASIWTRTHLIQGEECTFYSVTFERSYKDRDGAYRYTKSFDLDSLGKLVNVAQQTHEFITSRQQDAA